MTIEEMRQRKKALHLTNQELAGMAGLPVSTVAKVLSGVTENPRRDTIEALESVLFRADYPGNGHSGIRYPDHTYGNSSFIRETGYVYGSTVKKQEEGTSFRENEAEASAYSEGRQSRRRHFTIADYEALPEERRAELIDGRLYDLAAPTGIHQQIVMRIWKALDNCIEEHGMSCTVQAAPFDVQAWPDEDTIVQPDVMVFCTDPSMALKARATTAPDFICEVLSPSTAFRDRHLKLYKYRIAGVKEVWLVSVRDRKVEVYRFVDGCDDPDLYIFSDKVPVRISEGRCEVDFEAISKRLMLKEEPLSE